MRKSNSGLWIVAAVFLCGEPVFAQTAVSEPVKADSASAVSASAPVSTLNDVPSHWDRIHFMTRMANEAQLRKLEQRMQYLRRQDQKQKEEKLLRTVEAMRERGLPVPGGQIPYSAVTGAQ